MPLMPFMPVQIFKGTGFRRNRRRIGRHDMPHNERCRKPDSIGDKRRKKTPACSVVEQAGVARDRVIRGLRERKGLFNLLTLESIGFVATEDEDLTVLYDLIGYWFNPMPNMMTPSIGLMTQVPIHASEAGTKRLSAATASTIAPIHLVIKSLSVIIIPKTLALSRSSFSPFSSSYEVHRLLITILLISSLVSQAFVA